MPALDGLADLDISTVIVLFVIALLNNYYVLHPAFFLVNKQTL